MTMKLDTLQATLEKVLGEQIIDLKRELGEITLRVAPEHYAAVAKTLRDHVGKEIGPIAKPKDIRFGDNLPKTRSGKIMRRLLRSIAKGEAITQDTSTLENPAILDQLSENN